MSTERKLTAGPLALQIRESGTGPQKILFVHGNSGRGSDWNLQLHDPAMQQAFTMAAIDLPGTGHSDRSADYSPGALARSIVGAIDALGWQKYILAGISYGTTLIAEAAPMLKGCAGFAMLAPNVTNDQHPPESYLKQVEGIQSLWTEEAPEEEVRKLSEALALYPDSHEAGQFFDNWHLADGRFRSAIAEASQKRNWTDEIAHLKAAKVPCLFIFGQQDNVIKPDYLDNELAYSLFDKVVIANAGHFINKNQPEEVNRLLIEHFGQA